MYQLFFKTPNLLLLLYPFLLIKSMTYSLAIRFFSQFLVTRYRALNNAPHGRYLTEFWNFGIFDMMCWLNGRKIILILRNVITLKIILRNEIPGNNVQFKVTSTKIKYGYQINKKGSISKIKVTSDIFLIRGIFRTLKYTNVGRYLDPCQTYRKVFGKKFQAIIIFAGRSFLDHFQMFGRILNAPMYL